MNKDLIFVEYSRGEFEGTTYNNVRLGDGIETMKVQNKTQNDDFIASLKRGDKVTCQFDIVPSKGDKASVKLVKIDLKK